MKKTFTFLFVAALLIGACQPKPEPQTVNPEAVKASVDSLFVKLHTAMNSKEIGLARTLFTDSALACGTDPSEFISGKDLLDSWEKVFADTSVKIQYTIDKRDIRLSSDGQTALVIEQYLMPVISNKMQIRSISQAVRENDQWMIDFVSWNFITKNEEIALIDKALENPVAKK